MDIDIINKKILFNYSFAFDMRFRIPDLRYIKNLTEEEIIRYQKSPEWIVKYPDVIAKKVNGVKATLIDYWDGSDFIFPHVAFNLRELLNDDQGIELQANALSIFRNRDGLCSSEFNQIRSVFRERHESYEGYICVDFIITKDICYFDSVFIGIPIDHIFLLSKLYGVGLDKVSVPDPSLTPSSNFGASLRLWVYPYHKQSNLEAIDGMIINHDMDLVMLDECYAIHAVGRRIHDAWHSLYGSIPSDLKEFGLCYRTDAGKKSKDLYFGLKKIGLVGRRDEREMVEAAG